MNHRYTPYIAIIAAIAQVAMWTTATFRGPAEVGIPLLSVSTAGLAWLCGLAIADLRFDREALLAHEASNREARAAREAMYAQEVPA